MRLDLTPDPLPLACDSDDNVRVGGTRVKLDTIVEFYKAGHSPDRIAAGFPTVGKANSYAAIAYYLRHQADVESSLEQQELEAEAIRRTIEGRQGDADFLAAASCSKSRANTGRLVLRSLAGDNFEGDVVNRLLSRPEPIDVLRVQDVGLRTRDDPTILHWAARHSLGRRCNAGRSR